MWTLHAGMNFNDIIKQKNVAKIKAILCLEHNYNKQTKDRYK